jgi:DNA-binding transcriptional LysR family regulator
MSKLDEIMVFVRVAHFGSFTRAAKALGVPVSTVSRRVADLEARLRTTLIKRTTRKLSLTPPGRRLYAECAAHIQGIEEAEAALAASRSELEGPLRVTAPVALGRGPFVGFVSDFLRSHPKVEIDLLITNQFVDLVTTNVDIAIRFGPLADSDAVAKHLGLSRRVPVASPAYLKKRGVPAVPRDLRAHDCVVFRGTGEESAWELESGKARTRIEVSGPASANNFETVHDLAVRGHGIALVPEAYAVTEGVRRVLPLWTSAAIPVHAVHMSGRFVPAKIQAFVGALVAWKSASWSA